MQRHTIHPRNPSFSLDEFFASRGGQIRYNDQMDSSLQVIPEGSGKRSRRFGILKGRRAVCSKFEGPGTSLTRSSNRSMSRRATASCVGGVDSRQHDYYKAAS